MLAESLFFTSVFGSVGAAVWACVDTVLRHQDKRIANRLSDKFGRKANRHKEGEPRQSLIKRLGLIAAKPFMADPNSDKVSGLRATLAMGGIYDPAAIRMVIGFKFVLMLVGVIGGYVVGDMAQQSVMGASVGGLLGYLAPQVWLKSRISENQKALNLGLPDAMDLMVICVESGLTVDGTMQRVGEELETTQAAISREFGICHTEMRLGLSRQQAFKNLAMRTGNPSLQSLTAMLIQADRFGTSVAHALRVQAESMRTKRQFAAEEMAAKASVKMSFPLVLFIFPATFLVMMGPMIVQFMRDGFL